MAAARKAPWWEDLPDDELLDVRLCDLELRIEGTVVEERLARLYVELERVGLRRFRPYAWLSTSWFTPHGLTGFAVPFYLAHPRLIRLERWQVGEAEVYSRDDRLVSWLFGESEGASLDVILRLMGHETAHALDNAYRIHHRLDWRATFGNFSQPYRASYVPKPGSRHFVVNLDYWYAQSHP